MANLIYPTTFGDTIENLKASDLRIEPSLPLALHRSPRLLGSSPPTNQQALDAMKAFYASNQQLVDTSTTDTGNCSQNQGSYVGSMNGFNWKSQQLSASEQSTTQSGIFGASGTGGGIWDNTLNNVKASSLFTTIGVGVGLDLQFFVGGMGGLGCNWDIAKREGPRGLGYATGVVGIGIDVSVNIQCFISNLLPSQLDQDTWGLKVSAHVFGGAMFAVFFQSGTTTVFAYVVGIGVGIGADASIFGGHVWNFG